MESFMVHSRCPAVRMRTDCYHGRENVSRLQIPSMFVSVMVMVYVSPLGRVTTDFMKHTETDQSSSV